MHEQLELSEVGSSAESDLSFKTEDVDAESQIMKKPPYPKAVFLIVLTEFCERFSYYGMRAVLTIYLTSVLSFTDDEATTTYHAFLLLCYGLPVLWGIAADSCLNKFRTIWLVSIIFTLGNVILTASSITVFHLPPIPLAILGLVFMSIGTGGMKPCVAPLGGDQFTLPEQETQLQKFFSLFFFAMNIGNMLATIITPVLRRDVSCFGNDSCYPLAFGVPSTLMIAALIIFLTGKRYYKIRKPKGVMIVEVTKCISFAVSEKIKMRRGNVKNISGNDSHWLDVASTKFDTQLISDIKALLRVLVYYVPIPLFWSVMEQLGSRWTLQATRMTGQLGKYTIKADQMQLTNAVLMFVFIPFFETVVYPLFGRCGIFRRPLQRMVVGGFLAAISFAIAGTVQLQIQKSIELKPSEDGAVLNLINTLPCSMQVNSQDESTLLLPQENFILRSISPKIQFSIETNSTNCPLNKMKSWNGTLSLDPNTVNSALLLFSKSSDELKLHLLRKHDDVTKSRDGNAKVRIVYDFNLRNTAPSVQIDLIGSEKSEFHSFQISNGTAATPTVQVVPDTYTILVGNKTLHNPFNLKSGGSYVIAVFSDYKDPEVLQISEMILTGPNEVHMLWLLPQYIVMAWAETMFIIAGMEFSFTEAPESMKSVLMSCWHLSNAFGNAIVIISAQFKHTQSFEFFMFSGALAVDMVIFALMAWRYKYVSTPGKQSGYGH